MPFVSVVMPVYNSEKFLAEAIESILTQTFSDFELIIVDDGSTDCSAAIIQNYAERDDRIHSVQLAENRGHATARNRGIADSSGKYIAAMDSDDISLPDRLQKQLDILESNAEIGGVGVGAQLVNDDLTPRETYRLPEDHAFILLNMMIGGLSIIRGSMMVRREILVSTAGYAPSIRIGPDFELFLRLVWEKRIRYANVLTTQYIYRVHEASKTHNNKTSLSIVVRETRLRALEQLWGEVPDGALDRLIRVRLGEKLNWREWRLARRDFKRLIESMVDANWVDQGDRPLLLAEMHWRLESTTPRRWQMFLHWWRYRIGRFLK